MVWEWLTVSPGIISGEHHTVEVRARGYTDSILGLVPCQIMLLGSPALDVPFLRQSVEETEQVFV
jgi:hypothetical protein